MNATIAPDRKRVLANCCVWSTINIEQHTDNICNTLKRLSAATIPRGARGTPQAAGGRPAERTHSC